VKASKPQSMQEAIKFATEMMDKKMLTYEIRSRMEESNLYVPSEIITTMSPVLKSAPTVERLAIGPKMAPNKRTTRATPAIATTPTITITNAQLQALIDRGVAAALVERDADRSRNGDNSNDSGTELSHESCWTRCCLCNAMGGLEKDDHKSVTLSLTPSKVVGAISIILSTISSYVSVIPYHACSTLHFLMLDSVGPGCLAAPAAELSPISNPGVGALRQALFRGGMSASGISVLWEVDGSKALILILAAL
nr:hypothetical protein [Tanacetum cinerariifolium]